MGLCIDVLEDGEWSKACITHACNGALVAQDGNRYVYDREVEGVPAFKKEAPWSARACTRSCT
jgi:hypothetical protein